MLPGDRTDRAPRGEPVGDQHPLLLAQVPPAPRLLGLDRHCRIVQDLPDGIHDRAAVAPPRARLAVDPDHPARLSVTDPLRYQPHVPPLLLGLHTARRSSPSLPHRTLQTGLMLRRPLESARPELAPLRVGGCWSGCCLIARRRACRGGRCGDNRGRVFGAGGHARLALLRSSPWRKRQDSVPVSMMCALWVIRSTTAFASRASGNTLVHSPNGKFVVTIRLPRSLRSEMTWKTSSAAPSGNARYPSSSNRRTSIRE